MSRSHEHPVCRKTESGGRSIAIYVQANFQLGDVQMSPDRCAYEDQDDVGGSAHCSQLRLDREQITTEQSRPVDRQMRFQRVKTLYV